MNTCCPPRQSAIDVGADTHQIASQWTVHAPGQFLVANNWSSMGCGIPVAIAGNLGRPGLPLLCMVGDGCFQMTCGEVAVAGRLGITLPVVVLDDGWLSLMELKQIKRGFGVYGSRVRALLAAGPIVIEARIDRCQYGETVPERVESRGQPRRSERHREAVQSKRCHLGCPHAHKDESRLTYRKRRIDVSMRTID